MGWTVVGTPKTVKATKKLATEYCQMDPAPQDRPLSERRLVVYERMIRQGQFRPVDWAKAFCKQTNQSYRVNGKHTSTLLTRLADKDMPDLYVVLTEFVCDTLDDVAKLYATFDNAISARKVSDINASFAGTMPSLREIPLRMINGVVAGIAYWEHQDSYAKFTPAERAEALFENEEFALFAGQVCSCGGGATGNSRRDTAKPNLNRVSVVGAMYGMFQKSPDDAERFWVEVREETAPKPDAPTRKLAKFLMNASAMRGAGQHASTKGRYSASNREIFCKCIHAWNAWRKKQATNLNYHKDADVPDVV